MGLGLYLYLSSYLGVVHTQVRKEAVFELWWRDLLLPRLIWGRTARVHIKSCRKQCKHGEGVWQHRTGGIAFKFAFLCSIYHAISPDDGKGGMAESRKPFFSNERLRFLAPPLVLLVLVLLPLPLLSCQLATLSFLLSCRQTKKVEKNAETREPRLLESQQQRNGLRMYIHSYPGIDQDLGLPVSTKPLRRRLSSCPLSTPRVCICYPFLLHYRGRNCRNRGPLAAAALGENGLALKDAMQRRISTLATAAATAEVRLMIDAEQSWLQPAIDNTVYSLQVIHVRGSN